jgi:integrase
MIRPSFKAKKVEGRKSPWRVYIPPTLSPNGRPANVWGTTKEGAESRAYEFMVARRTHGELVAALSQYELAEAVKALELLRPAGVSLLEAVTTFLREREERAASKTFRAAFQAVEDRTGRSKDYDSSLRHTRAKVEHLLDKKIVDVTADDLENALKNLPPSTRNLRINRLRNVFNNAVKNGWLSDNPAARLDLTKIKKDEVAIYHPGDLKKLLDHAQTHDKELVPFLVVAAFCGLRPEREAFHLLWSDIHLDEKQEVVVQPELSKTRRKRAVPLSDNALEWLKAVDIKKSGPICDFSEMTLIRKRAKIHEDTKVEVVKDGMRHAFCSAHLAKHGDLTKSLLASGHTDAKIFWQHYYRAMSADEAEKYWSVKPEFKPEF